MTARIIRAAAIGAAGGTVSLAAAVVGLAGPAPASTEFPCPVDPPVVGDIDGDSVGDLVVGVPNRGDASGEVDVRFSDTQPGVLTKSRAQLPGSRPGDRFGQAVALGDLDGDACADILVGAPGAAHGAGQVFVVRGEPGGYQPTNAVTLTRRALPGDRFGSSVALAGNAAGDGFDLWVGSPGDDVRRQADAGSVTHYAVRAAGDTLTFTDLGTVTQDSPGVPGVVEPGDRFGAVLAASRYGVLVGDPLEDVGGAHDAGSATWLMTGPAAGPVDHALGWTQSSPGVPGPAEAGDHFGAAVSVLGDSAAVGVPGEDVRGHKDAGLVQTFLSRSPGQPRPDRTVNQSSSGIPGTAEPGDRFGAAVQLGRNLTCLDEDTVDVAVGAPREDLRVDHQPVPDAGSLTLLVLRSATGSCPAHAVSQADMLDGQPQAGDRLGAALGLRRRHDESGDQVFVGVPGEDRGRLADAGTVESAPYAPDGSTLITLVPKPLTMAGHVGGPVAHLRFGSVLATPAGD